MSKIIFLACVFGFVLNVRAQNTTNVWIGGGTGSWGASGNWSLGTVPTATEHVVFKDIINRSGTITLDGNRDAYSVSWEEGVDLRNWLPGTPGDSKLTVHSGNINFVGTDGDGWGPSYSWNFAIPETVANAVWTAGVSHVYRVAGQITAGTNTVIEIRPGGHRFTISGNNQDTLHADIVVTGSGNIDGMGNHSFGTGRLRFDSNVTLSLGSADVQRVYGNEFHNNGPTLVWNIQNNTHSTITGNLTGSGSIHRGSASNSGGTLMFAGPENTYSGTLTHTRGIIGFDGTFTGLGSYLQGVAWANSFMVGTGVVGLAVNANARFYGSSSLSSAVAPGRTDEIGTLTIGTSGNTNNVQFEAYSRLMIEIDELDSDRLVVRGNLNMNYANNSLRMTGTLGRSRDYVIAEYESLASNFKEVYWNDELITDPTANQAIDGTHTLVYGDTELMLMGAPPEGTLLILF